MVAAVVCYDNNYGIGFMGDTLFHCSDDMKHFKDLTLYETVIMGSNTYWSIENRPLKNRYNLIVSSKVEKINTFDSIVESVADKVSFHTMEEIEWMLDRVHERELESDKYFVIGGGKIYSALLNKCDVIYATEVDFSYKNVDTYFPRFKETGNWELEECGDWLEHEGKRYRFCKYIRVNR